MQRNRGQLADCKSSSDSVCLEGTAGLSDAASVPKSMLPCLMLQLCSSCFVLTLLLLPGDCCCFAPAYRCAVVEAAVVVVATGLRVVCRRQAASTRAVAVAVAALGAVAAAAAGAHQLEAGEAGEDVAAVVAGAAAGAGAHPPSPSQQQTSTRRWTPTGLALKRWPRSWMLSCQTTGRTRRMVLEARRWRLMQRAGRKMHRSDCFDLVVHAQLLLLPLRLSTCRAVCCSFPKTALSGTLRQ